MILKKKKPVILTGDLNVGHLDLDIHNPDAKHIAKQAALTPQERGSFSNLLTTTGFIDAFRFFDPGKSLEFCALPMCLTIKKKRKANSLIGQLDCLQEKLIEVYVLTILLPHQSFSPNFRHLIKVLP